MRLPKPESKKARIEIIPMIDAIFFLLVFFMFSSLSMVKLTPSDVELPTANARGAQQSVEPSNRLVISLTAGNGLFVENTKVARADLARILQERIRKSPTTVFIVNLSKTQSTQNLLDVIDAVNGVRVPKGGKPAILVATEPVDTQGNPLPAGQDVGIPR